jgi:hypothetical protein
MFRCDAHPTWYPYLLDNRTSLVLLNVFDVNSAYRKVLLVNITW